MCIEQTKPEYFNQFDIYQNQAEVREQYYQGMPRDFQWLMQHLLPINDKIRGCELIFPDTVLFHRGKPKVIIKNDKEFCLLPVRQMSKLNLQSIYKEFSNVVRERKKDFSGPFMKLYGNVFSQLKGSEILNALNGGGSGVGSIGFSQDGLLTVPALGAEHS